MNNIARIGLTTFILACGLNAGPITYTFSGTGTMGATALTTANFLVTLTGNTLDVAFQASLGAIGEENLSGMMNITGIGTFPFTQQLFIYTNGTDVGVGVFGKGNLITIPLSITNYGLVTNQGPMSGPILFWPSFTACPSVPAPLAEPACRKPPSRR